MPLTLFAAEETDVDTASVLDASVLDSISGAGLNVLMRLRNNEESLRLFNVSNEVYNTLRSNGLTELMTVERNHGIAQ